MSFDPQKHLVSKDPISVTIEANGEAMELQVKGIPYSKKNQMVMNYLHWDSEGNGHFDKDGYERECLKFMIVEAPWGATTDIFLSQLGDDLGEALSSLVPAPFKGQATRLTAAQVKKGS